MSTDLRLLRSLVALADEGHAGRAAARLSLTQPALSKHIAQLERSTGLQLFRRHAKGMVPTPAGLLLVERARHLLAEADDFAALAARTRRALSGRLALGFIAQAANEQTPLLLRAYHDVHPDLRVDLRQYDMTDLTAGLASGVSDLALLRLPVGAPDLAHEPVLVEPRVAVLPRTHRLAGRERLRVADLFDDPWVVSASSDPVYQRFALAADDRGGRPPILGPTVRSTDEYLEVVLAHQAVGLAPASAARYYARPGITYVPVPDAQPSVCALSWSTRHPPQAPAQAMIDIVRTRALTPVTAPAPSHRSPMDDDLVGRSIGSDAPADTGVTS